MIDTVDEKPCCSFEKPAPIQITQMKILAATIMSTKLLNSPNASSVGTYCSERADRNTILSRNPIRMIRQQYVTTAHCGKMPALPSGSPSIGSPERNNIMISQKTMIL
jgi:hypothetical protein